MNRHSVIPRQFTLAHIFLFLLENSGKNIIFIKNYANFSRDLVAKRVEFNGQEIVSSEIINEHPGPCLRPIVFQSTPDECKDFCSEDFCYII